MYVRKSYVHLMHRQRLRRYRGKPRNYRRRRMTKHAPPGQISNANWNDNITYLGKAQTAERCVYGEDLDEVFPEPPFCWWCWRTSARKKCHRGGRGV